MRWSVAAVLVVVGILGSNLLVRGQPVLERGQPVLTRGQPGALTRPAPLLPPETRRVVFLGDSITQAGDYVADVATWLAVEGSDAEVLNLGLASETAAELTVAENSDHLKKYGFGRPCVAERLGRVLSQAHPDVLIACYGMNDGSSLPADASGLERFSVAITRLREAALKSGVKRVVLCTPPVQDAKGNAALLYHDANLTRFSDWLVGQRANGWEVVDIHGPMRRALDAGRAKDPRFQFASDGIHPGREGHWLMAREILTQGFGAHLEGVASAEGLLPSGCADVRRLARERMSLLFGAWMTQIGHHRPGVPGGPGAKPGPSVADATAAAAKLTAEIAALLHATSAATTAPDLGAQRPAIDPRGPIVDPAMPVTVSPEGVRVHGFTFTPPPPKPTPWKASWIWLGTDSPMPVAMFRKEVTLEEAPRSVRAWISADESYRLYVNGRLVARGPVDQGKDYLGGTSGRWFYDSRDLTSYFTGGVNVISAEVWRKVPIGPIQTRGQGGLLFEAEVQCAAAAPTVIASDASWRSAPAAQFPEPMTYEPAREPAGWRARGFDDGAWAPSKSVEDRWQPLVPSEIPTLMEARYPALRIDGLDNHAVIKDSHFDVVFDRALSARPTLRLRGGRGATVTIKAHNTAKILLSGGEVTFEFPFMTEIAPSYTVELANVTEPVEVLEAGANFTSQPVDYVGSFECSDDHLNAVWRASRWAVQICLQTHHLDSPNHQEPISDPGDYVIESMVNYDAFAQPWLARQDLRKFAWILERQKYTNFHTSYSIAWLQMLMDYYDHTGDAALVRELAPNVYGLLDRYATWVGKNGLISEAPNYMFMDWVTIGGFACHHPPAVIGQGYLTALYYHGLEMAARVATVCGDADRAATLTARRPAIAAAFERELWVPDKGLYRDGKPFQTSVPPSKWLPADKDIETFSPHVNALAVLYDLAPAERRADILRRVVSAGPLNVQPWFMHWVFPAIDHAGLFSELAPEQLSRWKINPPTQSFREMWNAGDLSHGWCSTPLVQMSSRVLGVSPATPGFKTIDIRPQPCGLTWAKGTVPTPQGPVEVSWKCEGQEMSLDVVVPPGSEAVVTLPADLFEEPACLADGAPSQPSLRVASGRHHFALSGTRRAPSVTPPASQPATEPASR